MRGWRLAVVLCLCAAAARAQEPASNAEYRLGPRDLVEIKVLEIPELNVERRVSERGTVALPLLGDFPVEGLTAAEFRTKLEALLKEKYVNRADVSIVVKDFANKPVTVVGAVQHPGALTISGRWSLLQAISAAGGLTEGAGRKIYVLRRADNGLTDTLEVSTDDLFRSAAQMWNVPIYPSDVVNVPARSTLRIFCIGEVKTPGAVEFTSDDRITLLSVLAKAGGLTDRASKTIRIKRRDASGRDVETVVDFKRVLSGKDPDPTLRADDVVVIKESFF
jgi:polysaccharide export outer membrane protein